MTRSAAFRLVLRLAIILALSPLAPWLSRTAHAGIIYVNGPISTNTTWTAGNVYVVQGDTTVAEGFKLTIQPGVVVKFKSQTRLIVAGALDARGTPGSRIVFTSFQDDAHGGDTDGDGPASPPQRYDWGWIEFADSSDDGTSFLEYCTFLYGGKDYYSNYNRYHGAITLYVAQPTVANCAFEHNFVNGIDIPGGTHTPTATENSARWHNTDVVYTVTSDLIIAEGWKLTIDPAVTVKFSTNTRLIVEGALDARGTATGPIVFTSLNDDAHGGDTDADGTATPPAKNDWGWIEFADSSDDGASHLEYCAFLYGGKDYYANYNRYHGAITLYTAQPAVVNCTFEQNYVNGIDIPGGTYTPTATENSARWHNTGVVYTVTGDVTVADGMKLVLESDLIVKFMANTRLIIAGALDARGTLERPIIFTSVNDDAHGGDTDADGDSTPPARYDWGWIEFTGSSDDGASYLRHCAILYGGRDGSTHGAVTLVNASPTVADCSFEQNHINGIDIPGGTKSASAGQDTETWHNVDVVYAVTGDLTIAQGMNLVLDPGLTVKLPRNAGIYVQGALDARGAPAAPIVFTSLNDDAHGGDTDADGANTPPAPGDWDRIQFDDSSDDRASILEDCTILYASYALVLKGASPAIHHNHLAHGRTGLWTEAGAYPDLRDNLFFGNVDYAVNNRDKTTILDAEANWWGHTTGPYDPSDDRATGGWYNPGGRGDRVSDYVDYMPWKRPFPDVWALVDPLFGGVLYAADGSTDVSFPPAAVAETVVVSYSLAALPPLPAGLAAAGQGFQLQARTLAGQPVDQLLQPAAITIHYSDGDLLSIAREQSLALYRWTGSQWQEVPTSLDTTQNTAVAETSKLGVFALLGERRNAAYLPLLRKNRH